MKNLGKHQSLMYKLMVALEQSLTFNKQEKVNVFQHMSPLKDFFVCGAQQNVHTVSCLIIKRQSVNFLIVFSDT